MYVYRYFPRPSICWHWSSQGPNSEARTPNTTLWQLRGGTKKARLREPQVQHRESGVTGVTWNDRPGQWDVIWCLGVPWKAFQRVFCEKPNVIEFIIGIH